MASKKSYFKSVPIPLIQQKVSLCANYADSSCVIKNDSLLWSAKIKPTPLSKEYSVIMTYKMKKNPKIWIIGDELDKLDSPDFPHKYDISAKDKYVRICLYRYSEFDSTKYLANTIVPWIIEWLYYYELWLTTGNWLGGGEHPSSGVNKNDFVESI